MTSPAALRPNPYFPIAQLQCETDTGIETVPLALEQSFPSWQTTIPERYRSMDAEELSRRIRAKASRMGEG